MSEHPTSEPLEQRLHDALRVVPAPPELWTRVEQTTLRRSRLHPPWGWLAMAAVFAAVAAGGVVYLRALDRAPALHEFAVSAYARASGAPPVLDVSAARFAGLPATVTSFALGQDSRATLVAVPLARPETAARKSVRESAADPQLVVFEWSQGGQQFALVTSARTGRRACRLCHSV